MGRAPCCAKVGLHRGLWTAREDTLLINYIQGHGEGHWRSLPKRAGLLRCGKSCRLRWMNYLRPDINRGNITPDDDDLIIRLHSLLGNPKESKNRRPSQITSKEASSSNRKTKKTSDQQKQKNIKDKQESNERKETTIKVHQPKAIRVSPFSVITSISGSSFESISGASSMSGGGSKLGDIDTEGFYFPPFRSEIAGDAYYSGNGMVYDEDEEFPYGFDAAAFLDSTTVGECKMLDDIFEEYQQLLKGNDPGERLLFLILY
ncbi:hypothetical protein DITRI_Ditri04bG0144800 [Diplodiscus trichospermus]